MIAIATLLVGVLLTSTALAQPTQPKTSSIPHSGSVDDAVDFLRQHMDDAGCIDGSARNTAWAVMAVAATGQDPQQPGPNGASLVDGLKACDPGRMLFGEPLTSIERHLLAVVAAGEDPTDFNGRDWKKEVQDSATSTGFLDPHNPNGLNDDMFGILSLVAAGVAPGASDIQNAADRLLAHQNSDGGWSHSAAIQGNDSDTDMTAAALQALVRAGRIHADHAVTQKALDYLEDRAADTDPSDHPGCFAPRNDLTRPDMDSTSWAILGLLTVQQDPRGEPWRMHDTPWDCLLGVQQEDGGFPSAPGASAAPWPTAYAILALTGTPFAAIQPEMIRPSATLTTSATPVQGIPVEMHAEGPAFAAWQHEDGSHWTGRTIKWTPDRPGRHRFEILLLDDDKAAGLVGHTILVLPETPENETDPSEPGHDHRDTETQQDDAINDPRQPTTTAENETVGVQDHTNPPRTIPAASFLPLMILALLSLGPTRARRGTGRRPPC